MTNHNYHTDAVSKFNKLHFYEVITSCNILEDYAALFVVSPSLSLFLSLSHSLLVINMVTPHRKSQNIFFSSFLSLQQQLFNIHHWFFIVLFCMVQNRCSSCFFLTLFGSWTTKKKTNFPNNHWLFALIDFVVVQYIVLYFKTKNLAHWSHYRLIVLVWPVVILFFSMNKLIDQISKWNNASKEHNRRLSIDEWWIESTFSGMCQIESR